jgi:hypothetical protein
LQPFRRYQTSPPSSIPSGKWIIDLPPTDEMRLGPFRTQQEALDARREYIIRTLSVNMPRELPF